MESIAPKTPNEGIILGMNRLRKWVFSGLAVISLILFAGTCWLWIRSYSRTDYLTYGSNTRISHGASWGIVLGQVQVGVGQPGKVLYSNAGYIELQDARIAPELKRVYAIGRMYFSVHQSFILIAFAVLPLFQWTPRFWRKSPRGLCEICGYDLRATPNLCPECGTVQKITKNSD